MKLSAIKLPVPRWLMDFAQARDGLAAIEFAILAPIMLLIYFGMTEFSQAYMASRRANHMASISADLIAQGETTSKAEIQRAFDIGGLVLKPFDPAPLSLRISSVTWVNGKGAVVDWSQNHNTGFGKLEKNDVMTGVPQGLLTQGQSMIVGESYYVYEIEFARVVTQPLKFERRYYLRPRTADKITCSNC